MTAWMVRTGHGPSHPHSGRRRRADVPRVPGVLAGTVALLTLACGVGVAHATDDVAPGGHGAHGAHGAPAVGIPAQQPSGGGEPGGGGDPSRSDDAATAGGSSWMRAAGVFSPPGSFVPSDALTYDTRLVPAGARIEVTQFTDPSGTRVGARLRGLVPGRAYGMHVHTSPCGADPAAAGPHYQHRPAATADPVNEVWLDFRTDEDGDGRAEALHGWDFREGGARSVIIHDRQGGAGERAACFTVPFGPAGRV
ncbi:superoxide dismutase family protein [Streptomyces sp. MW-W600-10]|uniref:superoxide dismutase family protein n=1 Tax=Streptomyces sp. MW-W600-10 TaxID=2829819 RepID=UPI001C468A42|nr:superoxide dismutase family protein [Streptomyces sp. MW-W600-10]MBV7248570.1 superoxide dismutase family protein [Streptomyces sp. MW-W600-10]